MPSKGEKLCQVWGYGIMGLQTGICKWDNQGSRLGEGDFSKDLEVKVIWHTPRKGNIGYKVPEVRLCLWKVN